MKNCLTLVFALVTICYGQSQERTVGLLSYDQERTYEGYNLVYPHGQSAVYLLNNCGEVVHSWSAVENYVPGNSAYLTQEGNLIRSRRWFNPTADSIWAGGGGQFIEAINWDGNQIWSFEQKDTLRRLHHDFEVLENGNVLMISWEKKTKEEAIEQGRDPDNINLGKLWPDYILEYNPVLDSIVWEWHSWDHLIQDFDVSKANFGSVLNNPGKVDINFENNMGNADWHHMNSIDYNPELDQILLSVPHFDEIWIIDHSTTTEEAKTNQGGRSGKGGEILFRWGNPITYRAATEESQLLFFQHDVQWINDFIDPSDPLYNKLLIFNNRFAEDHSVVNVVSPVLASDSANYELSNNIYLPSDYDITLTHPIKENLFSTGLSSAQYLPNGNFLILSGRFGYAFELTPENEIVWEYKMPFMGGQTVEQGTELSINANVTFRFKRYPIDYPAFSDKDLSPKGLLQIEENEDLCNRIVSNDDIISLEKFSISPNPTLNNIVVELHGGKENKLQMFSIQGQLLKVSILAKGRNIVEMDGFKSGIYFFKLGNISRKVIKL